MTELEKRLLDALAPVHLPHECRETGKGNASKDRSLDVAHEKGVMTHFFSWRESSVCADIVFT